jgi:hypothetical protein
LIPGSAAALASPATLTKSGVGVGIGIGIDDEIASALHTFSSMPNSIAIPTPNFLPTSHFTTLGFAGRSAQSRGGSKLPHSKVSGNLRMETVSKRLEANSTDTADPIAVLRVTGFRHHH